MTSEMAKMRLVRALLLVLVVAAPSVVGASGVSALPRPVVPALKQTRLIRTTPFAGSATSMTDGEGMAVVPGDDALWLVDDNAGGHAYEVDRKTGALRRTIPGAVFAGARRLGGGEQSGASNAMDLEAVAYDPVTDSLFVFSGIEPLPGTGIPTAYRLTRDASGDFEVESFQRLPGGLPINGAAVRPDGKIYVGRHSRVYRYSYGSNTIGAPISLQGLSGSIYGMGFTPNGKSLFVTTLTDRLQRFDWATKRSVDGWTFAMAQYGIADARAVDATGSRLYVLDGDDTRLNGDPRKYAVTEFQVVEAPTNSQELPFYVMVDRGGTVYAFPDSRHVGDAPIAAGASAVDIVIAHDGAGYYVLDDTGFVHAVGPDAVNRGNLDVATLDPGEVPAAMSLSETGRGYWIFTNRGRAVPFGDAADIGDVSDLPLVGEIVDAAPYAPGFYLAGADGGLFTPPSVPAGSVPFYGSTYTALGDAALNRPIVTIYVDATDHDGYSLAASDGGMFNFESEFCGSVPGVLPGVTLNQPIVNAVPYGDCYVFFAADGGAFVFGDEPFLGSLGDNPPAEPIVSGDAHTT